MVSDVEPLASGVGCRVNVSDTPNISSCLYKQTNMGAVIIATKLLGGPHRPSRFELFVDSYGDGDFLRSKGSPWALWRFTAIILE